MNNWIVKTKWRGVGPIHHHFGEKINICINIFPCTNIESCICKISGKIHKEQLTVTVYMEGNCDQTGRNKKRSTFHHTPFCYLKFYARQYVIYSNEYFLIKLSF